MDSTSIEKRSGSRIPEFTGVLLFGTLAPLFFSVAFVVNKVLGAQGAHWYWNASLRYFLVIPMLMLWVFHKFGWRAVTQHRSGNFRVGHAPPTSANLRVAYFRAGWGSLVTVKNLYLQRWWDWTIAGLTGCVGFYLPITFVQAQPGVPAWVVASTFVLTIPMGRVIHRLFGKTVPREVRASSVWVVVAGVVIINLEKHGSLSMETVVSNLLRYMAPAFLPVILAALSFAYSHEVVASLLHGSSKSKAGRKIQPIDHPHMRDETVRVLLMDLASVPIWLALIPIIKGVSLVGNSVVPVGLPSVPQIGGLLLVAFFSAFIGRTFFTRARQVSADPTFSSVAEVLLGLEIIYVLGFEHLVLGEKLPGNVGVLGIVLVCYGLTSYIWSQRRYQKKKSDSLLL